MIPTTLLWYTLSERRPEAFKDVFVESRKFKCIGIAYWSRHSESWHIGMGQGLYEEVQDSDIILWAEIPRVR